MNKKTEERIAEYIEYLKHEHMLSVSVHLSEKYVYVLFGAPKLWTYNIHVNPYCFHVKSNSENRRRCLKCQYMTLKKCGANESFTGACHAGVGEYVHRICANGETAGFISISGYRSSLKPFGTDGCYDENMKAEEIPKKLLDTLIFPLSLMIERLISETVCGREDVYSRILGYLNEHHTDICVEMLAEKFYFSKSYISHMFKKKSGCTLNHYCNLLKIKDAKALLEGTDMSVTDIAFSVGFGNFSYFISTFKKITGVTPLVWRKKEREHK